MGEHLNSETTILMLAVCIPTFLQRPTVNN